MKAKQNGEAKQSKTKHLSKGKQGKGTQSCRKDLLYFLWYRLVEMISTQVLTYTVISEFSVLRQIY